jgi:hypothetical protein
MNGYDEASRTLRWESRYGSDNEKLLRLLRKHARTLRQLHVE